MKKILLMTVCGIVLTNAQANAEIMSDSECDGKCTWFYNSDTQEVFVKVNEGETGEILLGSSLKEKLGQSPIKSFVIGEGITGNVKWSYPVSGLNAIENSVLKLPNSYKIIDSETSGGLLHQPFTTVDCSSLNDNNLTIRSNSTKNIIVNEKSQAKITIMGYNDIPNIKIQCKGSDLNLCQQKASFPSYYDQPSIPVEYYKGYDNNRLEEEWSENGGRFYTYAKNGDYTVYDSDGNNLGNFMADGQKRRIYTIDEAVSVTEKGAKNRFVLRYR